MTARPTNLARVISTNPREKDMTALSLGLA